MLNLTSESVLKRKKSGRNAVGILIYTRVIWEQMDGVDVTFSKFIKRFLKFYQNYNFI